jgi:hypothetical protein
MDGNKLSSRASKLKTVNKWPSETPNEGEDRDIGEALKGGWSPYNEAKDDVFLINAVLTGTHYTEINSPQENNESEKLQFQQQSFSIWTVTKWLTLFLHGQAFFTCKMLNK